MKHYMYMPAISWTNHNIHVIILPIEFVVQTCYSNRNGTSVDSSLITVFYVNIFPFLDSLCGWDCKGCFSNVHRIWFSDQFWPNGCMTRQFSAKLYILLLHFFSMKLWHCNINCTKWSRLWCQFTIFALLPQDHFQSALLWTILVIFRDMQMKPLLLKGPYSKFKHFWVKQTFKVQWHLDG